MKDPKKKTGEISVGDIMFSYNISKAPKGKLPYTHALKVSMIDPITTEIMQDQYRIDRAILSLNEELNAAATDEEKEKIAVEIEAILSGKKKHNIEKYKYLKGTDFTEKTIKKYALSCAQELYAAHEREIVRKLKITPKVGHISAIQLFNMYGKDFLMSLGRCAPSTAADRERALKGACTELGTKPIANMPTKDLKELFSKEKYFKKRKLIEEFFEYCKNVGAFISANPVKKFFDENIPEKKGKKVKFYPRDIKHMSYAQEKRLIEVMEEHKEDGEIMAVALAKYARLSLPQIEKITWGDIIIIDGRVIIKILKENNVGRLHDFTRPVLASGDKFIIEKYNEAIEKAGDAEKVKRTKIIRKKRGSDKEKGNYLTKYIRNIMLEANITLTEINAAAPNSKEPGGAGVEFLHNHYDYVLRTRCGVDLDSPEGKFLRGNNPGDTMHQHYRSLTDKVSGIPFLQVIMRRDDVFDDVAVHTVYAQIEYREGVTHIHIPEIGPGKKANVIFPQMELIKGTEIVISSPYGVHGEISFRSKNDSEKSMHKRVIY